MLIDFPDVPSYIRLIKTFLLVAVVYSRNRISLANGRNLQRQKYNTSVIELPYLLLSSFLHAENKWLYEFVYMLHCISTSVHVRLYILAILLFCYFVIYFFYLSPYVPTRSINGCPWTIRAHFFRGPTGRSHRNLINIL